MVTELRTKEVITRKPHQCEWCGEQIAKGEKAQARGYVNDGDMVSSHQHPECYQAMQGVDNWELEEGWFPGDYMRGSDEPR